MTLREIVSLWRRSICCFLVSSRLKRHSTRFGDSVSRERFLCILFSKVSDRPNIHCQQSQDSAMSLNRGSSLSVDEKFCLLNAHLARSDWNIFHPFLISSSYSTVRILNIIKTKRVCACAYVHVTRKRWSRRVATSARTPIDNINWNG